MAKNAFVNLYLLAYNAVSAVGWALVLATTLQTVWQAHQHGHDWEFIARATWENVGERLKLVQSLAAMEILHAAVGLVRSPVVTTALQVFSRLFLVWAINVPCPDSRYQFGFPMMVISWSLVEVPRYSFYALNLYNAVPQFLFFLRYHLFMILYPTGVSGEVLCMVSALPLLSTGAYSIQMPNAHNVSVSLYVIVVLLLVSYIPGLPVMYSHMLTQRNRAYAKLHPKSKTA